MHVLITGANRGIGAEMATVFSARGDDVTRTARNSEGCAPLDVRDPASHQALADQLAGKPLDVLICNAGIYPDKGHALDGGYPPQMWQDSFATNVTGVFLTIQTLLPNLRKGTAPRIAILSSIMATDTNAPGGAYIYRASKAAVLNLGRNLAVDLKHDGIAVGIYHPGWVRTEMGGGNADIAVDEAAGGLAARIDALSPATTGCFEAFDGRPLPF